MAAALMLGAQGVYMGTRFLTSTECPVLPEIKEHLVKKASEMDTCILLRSFRNSTRMYNSTVAKRVLEAEKKGCSFEDVRTDVAGTTACKMFFENGDVDGTGVICLGETIGLIDSVQSCEDIIKSMLSECLETIRRFV